MFAFASWLSAWSLPFTIVFKTVSSVLPVGAPALDSLVRTIAVPLSRSLLISDGLKRHSVMRVETSVLLVAALLVPAELEDDGDVAADDVSVVDVPDVPATLLLLDGVVAAESVDGVVVDEVEAPAVVEP